MKLVCALALSALLAADTPAPGLEETVNRVQAALDATRSLSAAFDQETKGKTWGGAQTLKGRLWIQKPLKMRWEYTDPPGLLIVADGVALWRHDQRENTVYREELSDLLESGSPGLFLAGETPLTALFDIELSPPPKDATLKNDGQIRLRLFPKSFRSGVKGMALTVDSGSHLAREILIVDHLGARSKLAFTDMLTNEAAPAELFTFTPPSGARVVSLTKDKNKE